MDPAGPPVCWQIPIKLHGFATQKTVILMRVTYFPAKITRILSEVSLWPKPSCPYVEEECVLLILSMDDV